ncbi:MAG: hypothetical protein QOD92_4206 [Acidimicrobiaceae bacterium]
MQQIAQVAALVVSILECVVLLAILTGVAVAFWRGIANGVDSVVVFGSGSATGFAGYWLDRSVARLVVLVGAGARAPCADGAKGRARSSRRRLWDRLTSNIRAWEIRGKFR